MPSTEAEAEAGRAAEALAAGDAVAAIAACRRALEHDPDCLSAHRTLARAQRPGDDYLAWLARFHAALAPAVYLEIGVDAGRTLSLARPPTRAFGVDPSPVAPRAFAAPTRTFAMESDAFFASPRSDAALAGAPASAAPARGEVKKASLSIANVRVGAAKVRGATGEGSTPNARVGGRASESVRPASTPISR